MLARLHVDFENVADHVRLGAVDQHLQAFLDERVALTLDFALQRQQALFAGDATPADDPLDQRRRVVTRRHDHRSEEHTSELQSLMRISYAVFCLKKKTKEANDTRNNPQTTHDIT